MNDKELSLMIAQKYEYKFKYCESKDGRCYYQKGLVLIWWNPGHNKNPFWTRCIYTGKKRIKHKKFKTIKDAILNKEGIKYGPSWKGE